MFAQSVTLQGKQFNYDGTNVYPMVINMANGFACNCDPTVANPPVPSDLFLAPDHSYAWSQGWDCADPATCDALLATMFAKIVDMGFNTIRAVGMAPFYRHNGLLGDATDPLARKFSMDVQGNIGGVSIGRAYVELEGAPFTGPLSVAFFDQIEHFLDLADQAGLKVILLCVEPGRVNTQTNSVRMYPTYDQIAVQHYAEYLQALAAHLSGHPALMAYDLFNEPRWAGIHVDPNNVQWRKSDICAFTELWYDALKQEDPTHLVTLGGVGVGDLEVWDMSIVKVDFYSLHVYMGREYDGSFDRATEMLRFQGQLHWMSQQCPMPWIIGETGFAASDRTGPYPHVGAAPQYHQWPYMHGTEAEQATFAQQTLDMVRNAGASGWSWWAFQEVAWWGLNDINNVTLFADAMQQLYYGMLHLGDGSQTWSEKVMVDVVRNYNAQAIPANPGTLPSTYSKPYDYGTATAIYGSVVDALGNPVEHAKVGIDWRNFVFGTFDEFEDSGQQAFSNGLGVFTFDTQPTWTGHVAPVLIAIGTTAIGCSKQSAGLWQDTPVPPSPVAFILDRTSFELDNTVIGISIPSINGTENQVLNAWDHLQVINVIAQNAPNPGATLVEFRARTDIHVEQEFHAEYGSEVHIHLGLTYPDCSDDSFSAIGMSLEQANAVVHEKNSRNSVLLQFDPPHIVKEEMQVRPNPVQNYLTIVLPEDADGTLQMVDLLGKTTGRWKAVPGNSVVDLSYLCNGSYQLMWRSFDGTQCTTILKSN